MSVATWYTGDVFDVMAGIPDGSVDLIVTSPPFLALRSYLPADHPDKGKEIGSEATPAAFLSTLLALTREWRRILAPHGSICVELGDTYSGAGGYGNPDSPNPAYGAPRFEERYEGRTRKRFKRKDDGWPLDKSLCLLPTLYPASLAYGWNMLDPTDELDPWRIRNLIVWHRPNPPVGQLGDKVRPSTSYVTVACMRRDRWFDLDAERGPHAEHTVKYPRNAEHYSNTGHEPGSLAAGRSGSIGDHPAGAPPLDWWQLDEDDPAEHLSWTIPTQPYAGSHYATFPIALPRRLIRLMCPMHVCRQCGEPRRRIVEGERLTIRPRRNVPSMAARSNDPDFLSAGATTYTTVGWSDCGHDDYRRGKVLDPFAGSGTTLAAATEQGRDAIGIDLDDRNLDLARQRIGLFLEEAV